jgi:hypothetical protein
MCILHLNPLLAILLLFQTKWVSFCLFFDWKNSLSSSKTKGTGLCCSLESFLTLKTTPRQNPGGYGEGSCEEPSRVLVLTVWLFTIGYGLTKIPNGKGRWKAGLRSSDDPCVDNGTAPQKPRGGGVGSCLQRSFPACYIFGLNCLSVHNRIWVDKDPKWRGDCGKLVCVRQTIPTLTSPRNKRGWREVQRVVVVNILWIRVCFRVTTFCVS